jgi:CCR4-NOT transcription complex subunit 3
METFKDVERENKTKPHSKQGLSAEEKMDPREKEKFETLEWLNVRLFQSSCT